MKITTLFKIMSVLLFFVSTVAYSATYYSKAGQTNPNSLSNWTANSNGTGSNPANFIGGDTFIIQQGHTYTTTAAWTLRGVPAEYYMLWGWLPLQVQAESPAILQVNGALTLNHTLTLGKSGNTYEDPPADDRLIINGAVTANAQHRFLSDGSQFIINDGGKYILKHITNNNATTTFAGVEQFNTGSTFEYQNHGTNNLTSGVAYYNLVLNAPSLNKSLASTDLVVNGDMTVKAGTWALNRNDNIVGSFISEGGTFSVGTATSGATFTVGANLQVSGGILNISYATGNVNNIMEVDGNVTIQGGTLDLNANSGTNSSSGRLLLKGNMTIAGGTVKTNKVANGGSTGIYFEGSAIQSFTWSGGSMSTAVNNIGRRFFYKTALGPTGLNETYEGAVQQTTISGLSGTPATGFASWPVSGALVKNITIDNLQGIVMAGNRNVNEKMLIKRGNISLNSYTLAFGTAGVLEYAGAVWQSGGVEEHPALNGPKEIIVNNQDGVDLPAGIQVIGSVTIVRGILDLGTNTISRQTMGGVFSIADGAALRIGGTHSFPANYAQHVLHEDSMVEYYGTSQTISSLEGPYGNLMLRGSGQKLLEDSIDIAGDLTVTENAEFLVAGGQHIYVGKQVKNTGDAENFILEDNAHLVQQGEMGNIGQITVIQNSSQLYRHDYTIWSAPVAGQNLYDFSPHTLSGRFYKYWVNANGVEDFLAVNPADNEFDLGTGYLIRMPDAIEGDDAEGYAGGTYSLPFEGVFKGVPNNGTIAIPISADAGRYSMIGNPYPSPVNVHAFFAANQDVLDPVSGIYFWRKRNNSNATSYATLTLDAYVANQAIGGGADWNSFFNPLGASDWVINVGQGFFVRAKEDAVNPEITFNYGMRRADHNEQFFRTTQENDQKSMYWLNLTGNDRFSQMAVVYSNTATPGIDFGREAKVRAQGNLSIYSIIPDHNLAIQARPSFTISDVVPLGFYAAEDGTFTLALDRFNGVFEDGQGIYLKDNLTGLYHDLKESPFEFTVAAGIHNERFEVVYTTSVLGTETAVLSSNEVVVFKKNNALHITSGTAVMNEVTVFDTRGRVIYTAAGINSSTFIIDQLQAEQQMLILNISTDRGIVSKKVIY